MNTAIDAYVEQQMRRLNIPGVSLAIVEGDRITYVRGYGHARPDGEPPSPQTPFNIGSTAKSLTALAVMQLVQAGKIDLDTPVQCYLPWFRVADPAASARITVRHLLNQTSGLPVLPGWVVLADFDDRPDATERQVRALSTVKVKHLAGAGFEYSNANYNLLGLVIEAASGESYADYMQNCIFNPLGMIHTYTSKAAARQDGMAVGHQSWFTIPIAAPDLPVPSGSLPSGQLISSAEDMARYLIAHLNEGRCGEVRVLSPEGMAELHRPAVETTLLSVETGRMQKGWYGMGWYVEEQGQARILSHSGMVPDFYAYVALLPEQKKGVVLLANANHFTGEVTMTEVGAGVARLVAGLQPVPIRFGAIPWVLRGLPLIPLLQIAGVIATLRRVRSWRQEPQRRPSPGRMWGQHILLPLIPNLLLAGIPAWLLRSRLLGFMRLFAPDVSWIALISGGFAGIWAILSTGLMLFGTRNAHASKRKVREDAIR